MIQALRTIDHSLDVPSQNNGLVVTWSKHVNIPPRGSNNTVQTHLWLLYSAFYYLCGSFFFFTPAILAQLLLTVPYVCKSSAVSGKLSSELLYNSDICWISFSNFYLSLYCISTHYSLFLQPQEYPSLLFTAHSILYKNSKKTFYIFKAYSFFMYLQISLADCEIEVKYTVSGLRSSCEIMIAVLASTSYG